jgi:crossover junction endodeoxyribonuclease RusA
MSQRQADYRLQGLESFGVIDNSRSLVRLCLPIPPSANRYWRNAGGHVIVSEEAKQYKWQVALLCGQVDPFLGNVAVKFTVYRARKSGDLDNYAKVLFDALKGILYPDDNAIVEIHALRDDDKNNPRVELSAWRKE